MHIKTLGGIVWWCFSGHVRGAKAVNVSIHSPAEDASCPSLAGTGGKGRRMRGYNAQQVRTCLSQRRFSLSQKTWIDAVGISKLCSLPQDSQCLSRCRIRHLAKPSPTYSLQSLRKGY